MFQGTVKSQELVERQQGVRGHAITRVLLNLRHTLLERLRSSVSAGRPARSD